LQEKLTAKKLLHASTVPQRQAQTAVSAVIEVVARDPGERCTWPCFQSLLGVPGEASGASAPSTPPRASSSRPASASDLRPWNKVWIPEERCMADLGQYKLKMAQHALHVCTETMGADHPYTAMEAARLAALYAEHEARDDARALTAMSLKICSADLKKRPAGTELWRTAEKLDVFQAQCETGGSHGDLLGLLEEAQGMLGEDDKVISQAIRSIFATMAILETTSSQFVMAAPC